MKARKLNMALEELKTKMEGLIKFGLEIDVIEDRGSITFNFYKNGEYIADYSYDNFEEFEESYSSEKIVDFMRFDCLEFKESFGL